MRWVGAAEMRVPAAVGTGDFDFGLDDITDPKKDVKKPKDGEPAKPAAVEEKPAEKAVEKVEEKPKDAKPKVEGPKFKALVASQKEALEKCVEHASQVRPASNLYLRAVYLRAVCNSELQNFDKAVEGFRERWCG